MKDVVFIFRAEKEQHQKKNTEKELLLDIWQNRRVQINNGIKRNCIQIRQPVVLISLGTALRRFPGLLKLTGKAHSSLVASF